MSRHSINKRATVKFLRERDRKTQHVQRETRKTRRKIRYLLLLVNSGGSVVVSPQGEGPDLTI